MIGPRNSLFCLALACFAALPAAAYDSVPADNAAAAARQYTFAWPYSAPGAMAPRGGTTSGESVNLAFGGGEAWAALQAPGLSKRERDRRAILAMAGPYRSSFDFIETVGFTEGYTPDAPYQSWGTEYIYVVADEADFISLQHILVMRMVDEEGKAMAPIVVKHWRQDWAYEDRDLHTFRGNNTWERDKRSRSDVRGRWTQSVFQVDDTPRYQATGEWTHYANYSSWHSDETWRPLPRREFSVRDDYDVLIGTNRHTITPTGWVQEEENLKVVLDDAGERQQVLAREAGLARYERVEAFDWSPGDEYWARTGPFWGEVRAAWTALFEDQTRVGLNQEIDGTPLFMAMFMLAEEHAVTDDGFDAVAARAAVDQTLSRYLVN